MIERVQGVTKGIRARKEASLDAAQQQGFVTRRDELRALRALLGKSCGRVTILRSRGVVRGLPPLDLDGLLNEVRSLHANFLQERGSIKEAAVGRQLGRVRDALSVIDKWLLDAWKEFATNNLPSVNESTLSLLNKVPGVEPKVSALHKAIDRAKIRVERLPESGEDIEAFNSSVAQVQQLWSSFGTDQIPADVLTFLRMATNSGAPLDTLTVSVRAWLEEHSLVEGFSVRPKSSVFRPL